MSETVERENASGLGYECHDCGETYPPGAGAAACVEQGHHVGPVVECELPSTTPLISE